jgi:predicted RecA/RadA family phage recombinase
VLAWAASLFHRDTILIVEEFCTIGDTNMLNEVFYKGDDLSVPDTACVSANTIAANPVQSGDAVVIGSIVGVAATSAGPAAGQTGYVTSETPGGLIAIRTKGIFNLPVFGHGSGGNGAVTLGEGLYIDPATGIISTDTTKTFFGYALGTVNSGATATIPVKLKH